MWDVLTYHPAKLGFEDRPQIPGFLTFNIEKPLKDTQIFESLASGVGAA